MLFNYMLLFNVLLIIIIIIIGLQNYRYVHVHDDFPFHFYIMYNETFINFFVKMLF